MTTTRLKELNKILDDYRATRDGIDDPTEIEATVAKVKANFEHKQSQHLLAVEVKQAIDEELQEQLQGIVDPEHIQDISKSVQKTIYKVFEGSKGSEGYHVIPNTGGYEYREHDLIPDLLCTMFEYINS